MIDDVLIFKIGGRIIENNVDLENVISQLLTIKKFKPSIKSIILIAGGGSEVDKIRKSYEKGEINDEIAHWQAIKIMDLNALKIQNIYFNLIIIDSFTEITNLVKSNRDFKIINFLTFKFLKKNDELPHNWEVTSDTIAYFIAIKLNLSNCFLIKDIDGIYLKNAKKLIKNLSVDEFLQFKTNYQLFDPRKNESKKEISLLKKPSTPIDTYLLSLIKTHKLDCIILNGKKPSSNVIKFFQSINENEKIYTKLYFKN